MRDTPYRLLLMSHPNPRRGLRVVPAVSRARIAAIVTARRRREPPGPGTAITAIRAGGSNGLCRRGQLAQERSSLGAVRYAVGRKRG